jgi:flagellar motor switch protein FliN/FliY
MTTLTVQTAVAEAFATALPTPGDLTVRPVSTKMVSGAFADPITASFISGDAPALLAVVLMEKGILAAAAPAGGAADTDLAAPAIHAAAALLGEGSLSEPVHGDGAWISQESTTIFEIAEAGRTVAYFAVSINAPGTTPDSAAMDGLGKLNRIKDIEMTLTVEIGRTRLTLNDALNIEPGQVIELDSCDVSHADVLLNDRILAHGEVVVIDGDYGVRITKIIEDPRGA